ncbi:MAG: acetyl-CoA carboxylase biotin carboxyl carrier protein [Hyphomicrobiales bacterium]
MNKTKAQMIDKDLIRDLAELLDETSLSEIEIEQNGFRVRVSRQPRTVAATVPGPAMPAVAAAGDPAPPPPDRTGPSHHDDDPDAVTAPMVGTVYRAPAPGEPEFVGVGTRVSEGQTLLIIEAMKTMNPVHAPRSGQVTAILVRDGQPVEFGEALMIVN